MTYKEKITQIICATDDENELNQFIRYAYYLGLSVSSTVVSRQSEILFAEQIERAEKCEDSKMAMYVQGNIKSVGGLNNWNEYVASFDENVAPEI